MIVLKQLNLFISIFFLFFKLFDGLFSFYCRILFFKSSFLLCSQTSVCLSFPDLG